MRHVQAIEKENTLKQSLSPQIHASGHRNMIDCFEVDRKLFHAKYVRAYKRLSDDFRNKCFTGQGFRHPQVPQLVLWQKVNSQHYQYSEGSE